LGALSSPDAANAEKKRIEKILGSGTIELFADGGVNKLRYGKFGSKDEAESARATLKSRGIDGFAAFRP
jgi:cell division protein FtsN